MVISDAGEEEEREMKGEGGDGSRNGWVTGMESVMALVMMTDPVFSSWC